MTEYLEKRDKYHNPMATIKPEKGEITDTYYHSAVFDSGVDTRKRTIPPLAVSQGEISGKIKEMIRITFWTP